MKSLEKTVFGRRRFGVGDVAWLGLIVLIGLFVVVEFQLNVAEKWLGSYLEWHNDLRPRFGSAWESFDRTVHAVGKVDTLVGELRVRESEVESINNLAEVPGLLSPRGGISVSKEQFLRLIHGLSPYLWKEWMPVNDLMKLSQRSEWIRSYLWWDGGSLDIYLVDQSNGVLYRKSVPGDWLEIANLGGKRQQGILEETGEFQRRVYSADRLWQTLEFLHEDLIKQLMSSPGLQAGEHLNRIGLSNLVVGGLGVIGLEFSTPDGHIIERVIVRDDDLWDLGILLDQGRRDEQSDESL